VDGIGASAGGIAPGAETFTVLFGQSLHLGPEVTVQVSGEFQKQPADFNVFLFTSGQIALVDSGGTPITPEVTINGYASIGSLDVGFGGALGVVPEFANQVAQGFAVTMSTGSSQPILLGYSLSSVDFLGAGSSLSAPEPGGVGLIAVLLATLLKLRR
jgi:hypothetical protein